MTENIKRYVFSYKVAVGFAILAIVSGITNPTEAGSMLVAGLVILLGVFAYRSAKKRLSNNDMRNTGAIALELISIAIILFLVFMQKDYRALAVEDPIPNLIIPAWVLIAYLALILKNK